MFERPIGRRTLRSSLLHRKERININTADQRE